MLFDKKIREGFDAADLQPDKLWQDLASCFVNNDNWEIAQCSVPQLEVVQVSNREITSKIDVSKAPLIGLTGECVRLVFTEIRRMFTNISDAVMKPRTGCNATGEELYNAVWSRYINGKFLFFARPNVAMYVFRLWTQTKSLPKYTTKEMNADAQIRLGVLMDGQHFTLPTTCHTPRSDHQNLTVSTATPSSQTSSTVSMQDSITSYFSMKMKQESQSSETFRMEPPKPDDELAALLQKHELLSVWDSVNPFIFARTVRDFSFLSQDRLDVHVPPTKFPAVIRIRLEQCLEEAKCATNSKKCS